MVKKGVFILILLLIFLSAALENSYAKNIPRLIDEQDNMHPWGGDDNNNTGTLNPDTYSPIPTGNYSLQYNYGSKTNLISGLFMAAWDEMTYFFFGTIVTSQSSRDRTVGSTPTSSNITETDSGSTGGRSGL